ncbi:MAG: dihydrodipicolinate synthase family protein [Alphaproteobacteria bacterium]|nr:dihydrodipicolinate synthase family protein [Alphaproteobacteria bacterium]
MLSSSDLSGMVAMMPAFATDDAADLRATDTVDVERLHEGVNRMVGDGADAITITGSFGECYALLPEEFRTTVHETVAAVDKRIPVIAGVPSENAREAVRKIEIAREAGADAVLVAVPYYIPSTVKNAIGFFRDIAEMFPDMGILIYHNPVIHNITLPVDAFSEIIKSPNVIGMKDSHRDPLGFASLQEIVRGKMSVFVGQWQYFDYAELGAAGFWSIDAWMGPWPLLALRDAIARGDKDAAREITFDIASARTTALGMDLKWRETAAKIAIDLAGYVKPGPLRAPFTDIPEQVVAERGEAVEHWKSLCEKYRTDRRLSA